MQNDDSTSDDMDTSVSFDYIFINISGVWIIKIIFISIGLAWLIGTLIIYQILKVTYFIQLV